eukprot:PhM_4_TR8423/c0_g1_i2/m.55393
MKFFSQYSIPLLIYVVFGIALPCAFIGGVHSGSRDIALSDATVLAWALLLHVSIASVTFHEVHLSPARTIALYVLIAALSGAYIALVKGTTDPAMPPQAVLNDLSNTMGCALLDPGNIYTDVACDQVDYFYRLEPKLKADLVVNGSDITGPPNFTQEMNYAFIAGRFLYHLLDLTRALLMITIPHDLEDRNVETYLPGCQAALRRYSCAAMYMPCTGSCEELWAPCQSSCQDVLESCPGIDTLYDTISPGTDLRSVVYPGEKEIAPVFRALDRLFLTLKMKCPLGETTSTMEISALPSCINTLSFMPEEEGMCNVRTRAALESVNEQRMSEYSSLLTDRDNEIQHMYNLRRIAPFVLFIIEALTVLLFARVLGFHTMKEQLNAASDFWQRWWEVTPMLTQLAVPLQLTINVLLLLMARYIENTDSTSDQWYAVILENLVSLMLLNFTIETVLCYVRLEDECNPETVMTGAARKKPRRSFAILYEMSVYGKYFAVKVLVQELSEIVIQFTYFFVAISTTDEATIVVQATVLFVNLAVTPYLMTTRRSSVVLFDAVIEAVYFIINVFNALTRDEATQSMDIFSSLMEMMSLCFSSWGCVSSLYVLSQYHFHYKYTGMFMMAVTTTSSNGGLPDTHIVVRSVDENETGDEPNTGGQVEMMDMPSWVDVAPTQPPHLQGPHTPLGASSPSNAKLQSVIEQTRMGGMVDAKGVITNALVPMSRTARIVVCSLCVAVALVFYISTMVRLGMQERACRDLVGDTLWSKVTPKLLFPDGFAADTRCELSVATSVDLSRSELTEIPPGIVYFTQLHTVDVSHNLVTHVTDTISTIPLQVLDMSHNFITWVHPLVFETPPLRQINIKNNPFADMINWSYSNLTSIPRHLSLINATSTLLLNNNEIANVSVFEKFQVTDHLNLAFNNISDIPPAFFGQVAAKVLNISHNKLVAKGTLASGPMAQGISTLVAPLVDASYNHLDVVPTIFVYATTATTSSRPTIYLNHNNITSLSLRNMGSISVSMDMPFLSDIKDQITFFDGSTQWSVLAAPIGLTNSTSIAYLNLSDASWGASPAEQTCRAFRYDEWWKLILSFAGNLQTLDISYDPSFKRLCLLPPIGVVLRLPQLRTLWARGNTRSGIMHCERCFASSSSLSFPHLEEIDASGYNYSVVPSANITFPSDDVVPQVVRFRHTLKRLYLDQSQFSDKNNNDLVVMAMLSQLTQLQYVSFDRSDLSSVVVTSLPPLLRVGIFSNNKITSFPFDEIATTNFIETIDVTGNLLITSSFLDLALISNAPKLKCLLIGPQANGGKVLLKPLSSSVWSPTSQLRFLDLRGVELSSGINNIIVPSSSQTLITRVCVTPSDLSHCRAVFESSSTVCTDNDDLCDHDDKIKTDICGIVSHTYTRLQLHISGDSSLACTHCDGKCSREFVLGVDPMPSTLPMEECTSVLKWNE